MQHNCRRLVLWFSCRVILTHTLHTDPQKRLPEPRLGGVEEESSGKAADDSSSGSLEGSYQASGSLLRSFTQNCPIYHVTSPP